MGVFMIHLILFGDITILFTMDTDTVMVMDTRTVTIRGGGHTILGITTVPYGRNLNTNISFVSGRRGSRNAAFIKS